MIRSPYCTCSRAQDNIHLPQRRRTVNIILHTPIISILRNLQIKCLVFIERIVCGEVKTSVVDSHKNIVLSSIRARCCDI
jgi:hypothetical protein